MTTEGLGRVITRYGAEMLVEDETGRLRRCTARRSAGHPLCGDRVSWEASPQGNDLVTEICPRKNALSRPDMRGKEKSIAANIDRLVVVSAYVPQPNWEMVDRYLAAAALLPAQALLVLNKEDIAEHGGDWSQDLQDYRNIGYTILHCSARVPTGLEALREALREGTSIFVGQSGVGKSSLIQALLPEQDIRIGEISQALHKGQHTTTGATLYHLPGGGDLIDSPGVRDFGLITTDPTQLGRGFIEFADYAHGCRFHNCSHLAEPGCAVKAAVEAGRISARRYRNYRLILEAGR